MAHAKSESFEELTTATHSSDMQVINKSLSCLCCRC